MYTYYVFIRRCVRRLLNGVQPTSDTCVNYSCHGNLSYGYVYGATIDGFWLMNGFIGQFYNQLVTTNYRLLLSLATAFINLLVSASNGGRSLSSGFPNWPCASCFSDSNFRLTDLYLIIGRDSSILTVTVSSCLCYLGTDRTENTAPFVVFCCCRIF
jgi:hypothetical protein